MNHAPVRSRDWVSALLLTILVGIASQRLVSTGWAADLQMAALLALIGVLLGLFLGLSRFRGGVVVLFILLYSLVVVPFTLAAVLYPGQPWLERMSLLVQRFLDSLSILAAGNPLEDSFLLLASFSTVFWFIGLSSAYALGRASNYLGAVLPSGVVVLLLQVFDSRGSQGVIFTAVFMLVVLLLLGRMNFARRREIWQGWRVFPTGEARTDINLSILAGASFLVLTAWLLPVSSRNIPILRVWWQDMTKLWERSESLSNLTAGLEIEKGGFVNYFYGQYLPLGQNAPQNDAVLFHIQNISDIGQERYYWHIRSYDTYEDGLWGSSVDDSRDFSPLNHDLQLPEQAGEMAEFRVLVVRTNFGSLVTPPRPVWVNRPSRLTYLPAGEELVEPLLFTPYEPVRPGEEYLVHSIVLDPTVVELRQAGTDYPEWVTEHYLQLPSDLPESIIYLANRLTEGKATPYDKADMITFYLRRLITYTTQMDTPPAGQDPLAWFLFYYEKGFCNYYASAEVILLRAAGIPARLAVGFSQGVFEPAGWYTVRLVDAHAWPEVYFPGIGWIEFEPTSAQPELVRYLGEIAGPEIALPESPAPEVEQPEAQPGVEIVPSGGAAPWLANRQNALVILLTFFVAVLLLGGSLARLSASGRLDEDYRRIRTMMKTPVWIQVRGWLKKNSLPIPAWLERRAWLASLPPLAREFASVYTALRGLNPKVPLGLTPAEAGAALALSLPEAREEIRILLDEYQPAYYGSVPANLGKVHLAAASLRQKAHKAQSSVWMNKGIDRSKYMMDEERKTDG